MDEIFFLFYIRSPGQNKSTRINQKDIHANSLIWRPQSLLFISALQNRRESSVISKLNILVASNWVVPSASKQHSYHGDIKIENLVKECNFMNHLSSEWVIIAARGSEASQFKSKADRETYNGNLKNIWSIWPFHKFLYKFSITFNETTSSSCF